MIWSALHLQVTGASDCARPMPFHDLSASRLLLGTAVQLFTFESFHVPPAVCAVLQCLCSMLHADASHLYIRLLLCACSRVVAANPHQHATHLKHLKHWLSAEFKPLVRGHHGHVACMPCSFALSFWRCLIILASFHVRISTRSPGQTTECVHVFCMHVLSQ